jgi:ankyrin repeat protein
VSELIHQGASARTRAEHVPGCSYAGPLEVAVSKGFADVVSVLLEAGARPNLWMEYGGTCLTRAAMRGHEDVVRLLLEHGTSVDVRVSDGSTALHLAAHNGSVAVIKLLIEYGIEVDARSNIGTTALHEAVIRQHLDAARALLEAGADTDATTTESMRQNREDMLDLITIAMEQDSYASREVQDAIGKTPLYIAADTNQPTMARLLIAQGAQVDLSTNLGATPLHVATFRGHIETVKLLLEKGADASKRTKSGATTLHLAAEFKVPELVDIMLSRGVDPDILDDWNDTAIVRAIGPRASLEVLQRFVELGVSPNVINKLTQTPLLQRAVLLGHENIVKYLLDQNADVDVVNLQGATALHHAANHGFVEIIRLLLQKGANINAVMSERKLSVLHMTIMGESEAALECLLTWPVKPDTEAQDDCGYTALHYAVLQPSKELSELLLRHGANPNAFAEGDTSPLEKAVREQPEMVPLLIEYGADAALKRPDGLFVLMIAAYKDDSEMVEQLMKNQKSIDPLIEALAEGRGLVMQWDRWDDAGTLLGWAILNGQEILTWIILQYSSISANTPLPPTNSNMLIIATHFQHSGIVKLLLRCGAAVGGTDSTSMTAMHIAAEHGNLDIATTLIEHGCDINHPGDGRGTPLTWALRNKHDSVVRLLCQHGGDLAVEEKRLDMTVSIGPKQIFYGVKEDIAK